MPVADVNMKMVAEPQVYGVSHTNYSPCTPLNSLTCCPGPLVGQIIYYLTRGVLGACRHAPDKFKKSFGGGFV